MSHESTLGDLAAYISTMQTQLANIVSSADNYDAKEMEILRMYLSISENSDKLSLLACAQAAVISLSSDLETEIELTQFGAREKGLDPSTQNLATAVQVNRLFLRYWDKEVKKEEKKSKKIKKTAEETRHSVECALHYASGLKEFPNAIAEMLATDDFVIKTNSLQTQSTSEMVEKGVVIIAKNAEGHEREVRILPNGQIYIHAEVPGNLRDCKKMEAELTNRVLDIVKQQSAAAGAPLVLGVEKSGVGRSILKTKCAEETGVPASSQNSNYPLQQ